MARTPLDVLGKIRGARRHPLAASLRLSVGLVLLVFCGCGGKETSSGSASISSHSNDPVGMPSVEATTPGGGGAVQSVLSSVEKSVQGKAYDDAAASLVKLQVNGHQFTPEDAAAYRRALSDVYSRAVEAAGRGDPKAKAALQLMRAAGQH